MIDVIEEFNVYECNDGRIRCYSNITHKVVSYPKLLMENKIGRTLNDNEQVHHKDGNPLNNNLDNLEIVILGEHQRMHNPQKYYDKYVKCPCCGKEFLWTARSQRHFSVNKKRNNVDYTNGFCSRSCASYAGRMKQLGISNYTKQ